jgi:hypothetical protein
LLGKPVGAGPVPAVLGTPAAGAQRVTLEPVVAPSSAPPPAPPGRWLLQLAGVLTQIGCGACLLIGTIGIILVATNTAGSVVPVSGWLVLAMTGLVFGGLIYRGGLVNLVIAAALDAGFGVALLALGDGTLRALLGIVPASDVAAIGVALDAIGGALLAVAVLCLAVVPRGRRYARWFRDASATRTAMPVPRGSAYIIPAEYRPASRRRLYMVLGGLAIGLGAGFGVLVSATDAASEVTSGAAIAPPAPVGDSPAVDVAAPAASAAVVVVQPPVETAAPVRIASVKQLIAAQHAAIAAADRQALAALVVPSVFGFGVQAGEVAEGRDAVVAQLVHDLGAPPAAGFTVRSASLAVGEQRGHAWIAEELEVAVAGAAPRRFAVSELAAAIDGRWQIVALHWATPLDDTMAERLALVHGLPVPAAIADRHDDGSLDRAIRAAFASRAAFVAARSERGDAFNLGSGGERAKGGPAIKRLFSKLDAQIELHDGARVVAGGAWDPAQRGDPWIGWAAVNVDFASQTRGAVELDQTFRVLAIAIKEAGAWKLVQTQWSNAAPAR